jgi:hypothetical protein
MARPLAITAGLAGLSLLTGCADLMQQSAISQIAPGWFEEKAIEVKGEGYPELADIPATRPFTGSLNQWRTQADELKAEADVLEASAVPTGDVRTAEEIRATAAQWRAIAEGTAPLTPADAPGQ